MLCESEIEASFADYLRAEGWTVQTMNSDFIDVRATRGLEVLIAEVKGHTRSPGVALDIGYGQLLRRMNLDEPRQRYALVVPSSLEKQANRVPPEVRALLGIELYFVDTGGAVTPA